MDKFNYFGIDIVQKYLELGDRDPRLIAADLINVSLKFLGIVTVCVFIIGGLKWMLSAGREDKVQEAKSTITSCIIGLFIIICAWAIADFVLNTLVTATT
jgi:hypothetical protein